MSAAAPRIRCFAPVADPATAHTLILGSMPGEASLQAGQYYAHPRNQFWPIMGALFGAHPSLPYEERLRALSRAGIALWDVLASCTRSGSLDTAIDLCSAQANDFATFLDAHPMIDRVCFNGSLAERRFRLDVMPRVRSLNTVRLPSTSPAHAALSTAEKLDAWRQVLQPQRAGAVRARAQSDQHRIDTIK